MTPISDEALECLAQYWGRAQLMRQLLHELIDQHGNIGAVIDAGH